NIHKDTIDIKKWESIKEYMNNIVTMDFVILLISDAYLRSRNCMYEVLELMRDRKYKHKIFPAVVSKDIY
ncbi:toll/interleukin-1 receptor domain-containing protein, partial [Eggerthella sinensis]